jgi:L-fucose isomerase-like protein
MKTELSPSKLGVIVGNRGFFPAHLADSGRNIILKVLEEEGIQAFCLTPEEAKYGAVLTLEDSRRCANLFKAHRDEIDGILITLPNFGEETAIANALRFADLDVPSGAGLPRRGGQDDAPLTGAVRSAARCPAAA